jgi:chaperonin GroES
MSIRPLNDNILVKRAAAAKTTAGGLFIPDSFVNKSKQDEGHVVAAGPGRILNDGKVAPMALKVGDKVLFSRYTAMVPFEGDELVLLPESEVLAVLE